MYTIDEAPQRLRGLGLGLGFGKWRAQWTNYALPVIRSDSPVLFLFIFFHFLQFRGIGMYSDAKIYRCDK